MTARPTEFLRPQRRLIDRLASPLAEFMRIEAAGGILLLAATVIALVWANSPWSQTYHDLWHTHLRFELGPLLLDETLAHWVNDGLMVIFFFVVGLEIKRELLVGELNSPRKAALPIAAAVGGMAAPAIIFVLVNLGTDAVSGWAIPSATDIAFALGVMALLGKRVPVQLKVFLMAVAIVDDIGAVLIIAIFYTHDLSITALGIAGIIFVLLVVASALHVRWPALYIILGLALWLAVLQSGVHATIAGVLLAATIPTRVRIQGADFVSFARRAVDEFEQAGGNANDIMSNPQRQHWVHGLERGIGHVHTPLLRMEHALHPWVSFLIMPVFALANAGVELSGDLTAIAMSRVSLGIALGLVLGKQIGIVSCAWLATKTGLAPMPEGITWKQIYATSWLAGIGFTMSLFIAYLGFGEGELLVMSKMGVLGGSLICGVVGFLLLRAATSSPPRPIGADSP
jgi:NhaA family Na+:H+ antiporter